MITLKNEQKAIEQQISRLIRTDGRLKELFDLIVSVLGIGSTTATEIIVVTNEMTTITDLKQMVASAVWLSRMGCPFEYCSETSIRDGPPQR